MRRPQATNREIIQSSFTYCTNEVTPCRCQTAPPSASSAVRRRGPRPRMLRPQGDWVSCWPGMMSPSSTAAAGSGLMGILADAVLGAGGRAIGVIPRALATREIAHDGLTELHVVSGMHERQGPDGDLVHGLPDPSRRDRHLRGVLRDSELGRARDPPEADRRPEPGGYFDPLIALLDHGIAQDFIRPSYLQSLLVSDRVDTLIADLLAYVSPPVGPRWIQLEET